MGAATTVAVYRALDEAMTGPSKDPRRRGTSGDRLEYLTDAVVAALGKLPVPKPNPTKLTRQERQALWRELTVLLYGKGGLSEAVAALEEEARGAANALHHELSGEDD